MLTTYTYDRCNRLQTANAGGGITTYTHDAAGNLTTVATGSGSTLYTWDAPGRMATADVTAGIVNFTYNADGQRTAKQSTDGSATGYLYDDKKLLAETDEVGGDVSNLYATSTDQEFGDLISEDEDQYTHQYDAQANTAALLDNTGAVQATYKYYAFGNVASYSIEGDAWTSLTVDQWASMTVDEWAALPAELTTNMLAGGKKQYYLDSETELYLLGTGTNGRYYDATTGRFLSEDPIRQAGGDPNLYPYVQSNPINRLDPSGHNAQEDEKKKELADQQHKSTQLRTGYLVKTSALQQAEDRPNLIQDAHGIPTELAPGQPTKVQQPPSPVGGPPSEQQPPDQDAPSTTQDSLSENGRSQGAAISWSDYGVLTGTPDLPQSGSNPLIGGSGNALSASTPSGSITLQDNHDNTSPNTTTLENRPGVGTSGSPVTVSESITQPSWTLLGNQGSQKVAQDQGANNSGRQIPAKLRKEFEAFGKEFDKRYPDLPRFLRNYRAEINSGKLGDPAAWKDVLQKIDLALNPKAPQSLRDQALRDIPISFQQSRQLFPTITDASNYDRLRSELYREGSNIVLNGPNYQNPTDPSVGLSGMFGRDMNRLQNQDIPHPEYPKESSVGFSNSPGIKPKPDTPQTPGGSAGGSYTSAILESFFPSMVISPFISQGGGNNAIDRVLGNLKSAADWARPDLPADSNPASIGASIIRMSARGIDALGDEAAEHGLVVLGTILHAEAGGGRTLAGIVDPAPGLAQVLTNSISFGKKTYEQLAPPGTNGWGKILAAVAAYNAAQAYTVGSVSGVNAIKESLSNKDILTGQPIGDLSERWSHGLAGVSQLAFTLAGALEAGGAVDATPPASSGRRFQPQAGDAVAGDGPVPSRNAGEVDNGIKIDPSLDHQDRVNAANDEKIQKIAEAHTNPPKATPKAAKGADLVGAANKVGVKVLEQEGNISIASFNVAGGEAKIIGTFSKEGDTLFIRGAHVEGDGTWQEIKQTTAAYGKELGVKKVVIEGAPRTTGANPGHIPRPITIGTGL